MRIREVEQKTGLSRKAVRLYEAKGLLSVERSDNDYREYDEEDVKRLQKIAVLRRAGVSVTDIQLWQNGVMVASWESSKAGLGKYALPADWYAWQKYPQKFKYVDVR